MFSNRFTEEIPHAHDTDSGFFKKAVIKSDYLSGADCNVVSALSFLLFSILILVDAIPLNHADDIHVPPPNC